MRTTASRLVIDTISPIPVCVGYRVDGEPLDAFPADAGRLERLEPVYEELDGWGTPTGEVRRLEDLPKQARAYLDRIEALLETPVRYVGVGTRSDQILEAR